MPARNDSPRESLAGTRAQVFARLARAVTDNAVDSPLALRLCRTFVDIVGADGGAVTLAYNAPERMTLCVTDETADRLEDLQDVLGEGPGPDAYASGRSIVGTFSGEQTERWPMFADAARSAAGEVTVHAFPMRAPTAVLGVVTVYRHQPGPLPGDAEDTAFLADAIGAAIVRDSEAADGGSRWAARDRINQATGMVVAQLRINPDDALALMRSFAFSHALALDDVATEVLERRQDFRYNSDLRGDEGP